MNLGRPISILDFPGSLWTDASAPGRELNGKMYVDGVCMHACMWGMASVGMCVCVPCVCVSVYTHAQAYVHGRWRWGGPPGRAGAGGTCKLNMSPLTLQAGSITFNQSLRGFMSLNGREAGSLGNRELGP